MAININSNFTVGAPLPIDDRLVLTKEQMININEAVMPDVYFAICADDGLLYLFDKSNVATAETGKFVAYKESSTSQAKDMPEPTADKVGEVVQYIGETTPEYTKGYFYECVENPEGDGYIWDNIDTQVPGAGDAGITESITSNVEVGGISPDTIFTAGTPVTDILDKLLIKEYAPEVTMTITPTQTVYKKGTIVSGIKLTANVVKTTNPISRVSFYANSTRLISLNDGIADGGTIEQSVTTSVTADTTFKVIVTDGTNSADAEQKVVFVNPYYYGVLDDTTIDNSVTSKLTEILEVKGEKSVEVTADNQYVVFLVDEAYEDLTTINDTNGFNNISSFTKSTATINKVNYKVYISNTPVTCTNFKYTFK